MISSTLSTDVARLAAQPQASRQRSLFLRASLFTKTPLRALLATGALIICYLFNATAYAADAEADPAEATMKQLIAQVSTDLDQLHKANRIGDRAALEQLIRNDIIPSIDKERLTRRVFRQYWSQVEKAGRGADAQERVIQSLVRTYAVALQNYSGDTISLVSVAPRDKGSVAKTRLRRPSGETIQIDFNLAKTGDRWLVNDMAVDGIVISLTLFNAIKPVIEQQGLDQALNSLAEVDVNQKAEDQKADGTQKPKK
jgi:ABC-type transporter MlaC component